MSNQAQFGLHTDLDHVENLMLLMQHDLVNLKFDVIGKKNNLISC